MSEGKEKFTDNVVIIFGMLCATHFLTVMLVAPSSDSPMCSFQAEPSPPQQVQSVDKERGDQ